MTALLRVGLPKKREGFVASVSHDLRTPLSALQGQIDVLLAQPAPDSNTKESLRRMQREVRRLIRMANNLLLNAQEVMPRGDLRKQEQDWD